MKNTIERADGSYLGDDHSTVERRISVETSPFNGVQGFLGEPEYVTDMKTKYPGLEAAFREIQAEQYDLFCKKMSAYGLDNISLGADLSKDENKKMSLTGIWIRLMDKMNRLKNLVIRSEKNYIVDESIEDTFKDISNYAIISLIVLKGKWE